MPITPINAVGVAESSRCSNFKLACMISLLPTTIFSFFGAVGCYALGAVGAVGVEVGDGAPMEVLAPAMLGGILLGPSLYACYLLIISQKENCTPLYERTIERSVFFRQVADADSKISAFFALSLGYIPIQLEVTGFIV